MSARLRSARLLVVMLAGCGTTPVAPAPTPKPPPKPKTPPPVVSDLPPDASVPAAYQPPVRTLVAGADFTCGLRGGTAHCWGGNSAGQLGDGGTGYRFGPTQVAVSDIVSLAAGGDSACARVRDGGLWCWGRLGGENGAPRELASRAQHVSVMSGYACAVHQGEVTCFAHEEETSHRVHGLTDAAAVAVSSHGGCARTAAGTVSCWSFREDAYQAEAVDGLSQVVRIQAAYNDTCVLRAEPDEDQRTVLCFGPYQDELSAPLLEPQLPSTDLYLGQDWGCLEAQDTLRCWGGRPDKSRYRGDSVDGDVHFDAIVGAAAVAAGAAHLCGQLPSGEVLCLGDNKVEQLGAPSGLVQTRPQRIEGLPRAQHLVSGASFACAVGSETHCWGERHGTAERTQLVPPLKQPSSLSGNEHACGISGGKVTCWGYADWGQLGDEAAPPPPPPKPGSRSRVAHNAGLLGVLGGRGELGRIHQVKGLGAASSVAVSAGSTCAVAGGQVQCLGQIVAPDEVSDGPCVRSPVGLGAMGLLGGAPPPKPSRSPAEWCKELKKPHPITGTQGARQVVGLHQGFCALVAGAVRCWNRAQLQAGLSPRIVPGLANVTQLFGGSGEVCALHPGGFSCWSYATMFPRAPEGLAKVLDGAKVVHAASGSDHVCAVDNRGRVICWGRNGSGQLGRNKGVQPPVVEEEEYSDPEDEQKGPSQGAAVVKRLPPAKRVALGERHSCALARNGQVHCWGGPRFMLGGGDVVTESRIPLLVEGWP